RGDSNPHALRHWILSPARLPIPPLSLEGGRRPVWPCQGCTVSRGGGRGNRAAARDWAVVIAELSWRRGAGIRNDPSAPGTSVAQHAAEDQPGDDSEEAVADPHRPFRVDAADLRLHHQR